MRYFALWASADVSRNKHFSIVFFPARILMCRTPDDKSYPVPDESSFIKSTVNFNQ